jgi:hypothetical protein
VHPSTSLYDQPPYPHYVIFADLLCCEYKSNEVAADLKYRGRIIVIYRDISDIGKDILGNAYITVGGSASYGGGVKCIFAKDQQTSIANLHKRSFVKVKGEVGGKIFDVFMRNCKLVR